MAWLVRRGVDEEEAKDAVQDAWLVLLERGVDPHTVAPPQLMTGALHAWRRWTRKTVRRGRAGRLKEVRQEDTRTVEPGWGASLTPAGAVEARRMLHGECSVCRAPVDGRGHLCSDPCRVRYYNNQKRMRKP